MGDLDYTCECNGKTCGHDGTTIKYANVIIEVPLSDGTTVYLEGGYRRYGYVIVKLNYNPENENGRYVEYKFYLKEFECFFKGWFQTKQEEELKQMFIANRIWTLSETSLFTDKYDKAEVFIYRRCENQIKDDFDISTLTNEIVAKCIRADALLPK